MFIDESVFTDDSVMTLAVFLEGNSFEEVIRLAVSLGGDCDTLTAIAGSIAEGCYPIPEEMSIEGLKRLDKPMLGIIDNFYIFLKNGQ